MGSRITAKLTVRMEQGTLYFPNRDYLLTKMSDVFASIEAFPMIPSDEGDQIIAIRLEKFENVAV